MAEQVDINVNIEGEDELNKGLGKATKQAEDLSDEFGVMNSKAGKVMNTLKGIGTKGGKFLKGLGNIGAKAFKVIGTAIKTVGIGLLIGVLGTLWEAMKRNQQIMDLFETAVNAVGIVIQPLANALADLIKGLASGSEKFDAFGKVIKNVISLALKPFQVMIQGVKITVLGLMIAWERLSSRLSRKKKLDEGKVAEWQEEIDEAKQKVKELAKEAGENFTEIKDNVGEAIQEIKEFGSSVIAETKKAVASVSSGSAQAATDAKKNIEALIRESERLKLQYQKDAEVFRQIRDDETRTFEERILANEKLGALLMEQAEAERAIINEKIAQQQALLALDKNNEEQKNALLDLNNELLEIDERITSQQSEQLVNVNALNREKADAAQQEVERAASVADEIRRIHQESAIAELEDANQQALLKAQFEQENFERELQTRLANGEITESEMIALRAAYANQTAQIIADVNKKIVKDQRATSKVIVAIAALEANEKVNASLAAAKALLGASDAIFGETKAAAIAETIISTYQSAVNAFNSLARVPIVGTVLGGIAAAAAIASGIAQVNKIRQQDKPKGKEPSSGPKTVANQNPQFGSGGEVYGPSHAANGVDINAEGGEFVVRKIAAQQNKKLLEQINSGGGNYPTFDQVLRMINTQRTTVVLSDIDDQKRKSEVLNAPLSV